MSVQSYHFFSEWNQRLMLYVYLLSYSKLSRGYDFAKAEHLQVTFSYVHLTFLYIHLANLAMYFDKESKAKQILKVACVVNEKKIFWTDFMII